MPKETLSHLHEQVKKTRQHHVKTKKELMAEMEKLRNELHEDMDLMKEEILKTRRKLQDDMHDYVKQRYRWLETRIDAIKK